MTAGSAPGQRPAPRWAEAGILLADTVTVLPAEADGAVLLSGSHGGRYPGYLAAAAGARGVILNDAGVGRDEAGIGSLPYLEALGIPAATVSSRSCRIGDTDDMLARGIVSHANAPAHAAGVRDGMAVADAARLMTRAPHRRVAPPAVGEGRSEIRPDGARRRLVLLDSASLVRPGDAGQVVVTASHGGLIGGDPGKALGVAAYAAAFNDAGSEPGGSGTTRLPALDRRRVAALTVSCGSARIGEGGSTFRDGIVSALNETARAWGAREGERAQEVLLAWAHRNQDGP